MAHKTLDSIKEQSTPAWHHYVVTVEYPSVLVSMLEAQGVECSVLLEGTGIKRELLNQPEVFIPFIQYKNLIERALLLSGNPGLGLTFGQQLYISTHGPLSHLWMSSSNMEQVMRQSVKYIKIRNQVLDFSFYTKQEQAVLRMELPFEEGVLYRFLVENIFSSIYAIATFLFGSYRPSLNIGVVYDEPDYSSMYQPIFNAPLKFNQSFNEISFPAVLLQNKISLANPALAKLAEQQCEALLKSINEHETLSEKTRRLLLNNPEQFAGLDKVSETLHLSARTLRRQLKNEGSSYQKILDDVRKQLALQYLANTHWTVEEIANLLHYSDPSNFRRAFRKWTGTAPGTYRHSA
ncbi:AraC family transcriptional regulator [Deltaproteobacteria bacterium TL4]